jgi:hypothetical protein
VADHPLRPATDHRLGEPLPHQLANPTRAPPGAINLSPRALNPRSYAVLARLSPGYPTLQGRFPRVTHPCATPLLLEAFDLHVLGMPPAFVLSQDQTLNLASVQPANGQTKPGTDRPYSLSGIDKSFPSRCTRHQHRSRRRRPRIPSTLSPTMSKNTPLAEGAGLISLRPDPVNKLFRPTLSLRSRRARQKRPLRFAAFVAEPIIKKPPGAAEEQDIRTGRPCPGTMSPGPPSFSAGVPRRSAPRD